MHMQGAFRKVAVEAAACAKELTGMLKQRMLAQKEQAAECIQMLRKLGEPVEALQVGSFVCDYALPEHCSPADMLLCSSLCSS